MKKTENRGGKREGSGRKPGYSPGRETLSVRQVKEMLAKSKQYAKKYGKTIDEILLDFIHGVVEIPLVGESGDLESLIAKRVPTRDRIACIKLWKEYTSPKITEGSEADKNIGPAFYLPEQKPTLAVVSDIEKAKKSSGES